MNKALPPIYREGTAAARTPGERRGEGEVHSRVTSVTAVAHACACGTLGTVVRFRNMQPRIRVLETNSHAVQLS